MNHSGGEAHAYLYTPTVLISWFSSLLLLPLTPNLRIQRPPPNTLISHCAYNEAGILCYIAN